MTLVSLDSSIASRFWHWEQNSEWNDMYYSPPLLPTLFLPTYTFLLSSFSLTQPVIILPNFLPVLLNFPYLSFIGDHNNPFHQLPHKVKHSTECVQNTALTQIPSRVQPLKTWVPPSRCARDSRLPGESSFLSENPDKLRGNCLC